MREEKTKKKTVENTHQSRRPAGSKTTTAPNYNYTHISPTFSSCSLYVCNEGITDKSRENEGRHAFQIDPTPYRPTQPPVAPTSLPD